MADVEKECLASRDVDVVVPLKELSEEHFKKFKSILVVGDASSTLSKAVRLDFKPEIIVPAVPRHFAAGFLNHELEARGFKVLPSPSDVNTALKLFPGERILSLSFENSIFTFSYMPSWSRCSILSDQLSTCPVTRQLNPRPMFQVIREAICFVDLALTLEIKKVGIPLVALNLRPCRAS